MQKALALATFLLCLTFAGSTLVVPDFGGFDADQFPIPQEDPPVQPAGYAFAIWGVICLWLTAGALFGLLRRAEAPDWQPMRAPLCLSLAVGTIWLPVAVTSAVWAAILIWVMLAGALIALFRAPALDRWWAAYPLGLYTGWLSAAACVALGLVSAGWGFLDAQTAALVFVFLALVLASAVQTALPRVPSYAVAVVWALAAIVVQNLAGNATVAALAAGGALVLAWRTYRRWRATPNP